MKLKVGRSSSSSTVSDVLGVTVPVRVSVMASASPVGRALKVDEVPAVSEPITSGAP